MRNEIQEMIVYKTPIAVFVPIDSKRKPDLSRVPEDRRVHLVQREWGCYPVITSCDKEIFNEVNERGYSLRKNGRRFEGDEW